MQPVLPCEGLHSKPPLLGTFASSFVRWYRRSGGVYKVHPALADRHAGRGKDRARLLREYLERRVAPRREEPGHGTEEPAQAGCELSLREWRALSQACSLIWLHHESLPPVKGFLVEQVM